MMFSDFRIQYIHDLVGKRRKKCEKDGKKIQIFYMQCYQQFRARVCLCFGNSHSAIYKLLQSFPFLSFEFSNFR